jgi:hypothetical protein
MRGIEMSTSRLVKNRIALDIVVTVLSLSALYYHFFTNDTAATFCLATTALYFCGIAFIVNAITESKITTETNDKQ